jgi:hypothetical protein
MIIVNEATPCKERIKPVICPKCEKGRLGNIPRGGGVRIFKKGKPPPDGESEYFQIKCPVCGARWSLTIE